jgi:hypothetical protein
LDFTRNKGGNHMRPKDFQLAQRIGDGLIAYDRNHRRLFGIRLKAHRDAFIEQVLESIHRVAYPSVIARRDISPERANPNSPLFDPVRAAILKQRTGQTDEAFWFIFLFVHFGKHLRTGWRLTRDVYGCLGNGAPWTWARVGSNPRSFRSWLADNRAALTGDGVARHFGNHRKYESLDAWSRNGTGEAVESYVQWVAPPRTHQQLIQAAQAEVGNDARRLFHFLYGSMNRVTRFGRTAKFDYLTMLGKLNLAPIEPGSTYMEGATGPFTGARLLFGGSTNADLERLELDSWLVELGGQLGVGMQVLEDSLCNWQKSPSRFIAFRG